MRLAMNLDEDEDVDADDDEAPLWEAPDVEEEEPLIIPLDPLDGSNPADEAVDSLANLLKYDFISSSVKIVLSFSSISSLLPPPLLLLVVFDVLVFSKIWSRNDLHATS